MGGAPLISAEVRARLLADERDLDAGADDDRAFWRDLAAHTSGPILELGCGGGRLLAVVRAVGANDRALIGVDLDHEALALAAERLPQADLVLADARTWRSAQPLAAGLVIIGGDLLPLIIEEADLVALLTTAAAHLAPDGVVGIDATRIDPDLLVAATAAPEWGNDIERVDGDGAVVRRESRLSPDPEGRRAVALLSVRHRGSGAAPDAATERPPFSVRAWSAEELLTAANAAKLERAEERGGEERLRWLLRSTHE